MSEWVDLMDVEGRGVAKVFTSEELEKAWRILQGGALSEGFWPGEVPCQLEYQEGMMDRKAGMHPLWMWDEVE